jgi:hypothetical protein
VIPLSKFIHGRPYQETAAGPQFKPCAPHSVLTRLGDKWTILVMSHLAVAPGFRLRFSELKRGVEGITQRMLTPKCRHAWSMNYRKWAPACCPLWRGLLHGSAKTGNKLKKTDATLTRETNSSNELHARAQYRNYQLHNLNCTCSELI